MGKGDIIAAIEAEQLKTDIPEFRPGDSLRVHVKVVEGEKERIQVFEGACIRRHHGSVRETFTVRKISNGIGVERTFPLHSHRIDKIEVATRGRVRRAKLYYLRERSGRAARIRERRRDALRPEKARNGQRASSAVAKRPRVWLRPSCFRLARNV